MTVEELIEKLQQRNPKAIVHIEDAKGIIRKLDTMKRLCGEIYTAENHLVPIDHIILLSESTFSVDYN